MYVLFTCSMVINYWSNVYINIAQSGQVYISAIIMTLQGPIHEVKLVMLYTVYS